MPVGRYVKGRDISNSLIEFRFNWDLEAEQERSQRCSTRKTNEFNDCRMLPSLWSSWKFVWACNHQIQQVRFMLVAAASWRKSRTNWQLIFEVTKASEDVSEFASASLKILYFACYLFSHRRNCSVMPNQDEKSSTSQYWRQVPQGCEMSDQRPVAAKSWKQLLISTGLLKTLSLNSF